MTALMDVLQGAIDIDTNIFLFINGMHNTFFDYFMSAYSGKWVWVPMYAAIWYVMLRNFHWKVTLFCMVGLALVITIADQTGATLIRPYVERLRPANLENPIEEGVMDSPPVMLLILLAWHSLSGFFSVNDGSLCL